MSKIEFTVTDERDGLGDRLGVFELEQVPRVGETVSYFDEAVGDFTLYEVVGVTYRIHPDCWIGVMVREVG